MVALGSLCQPAWISYLPTVSASSFFFSLVPALMIAGVSPSPALLPSVRGLDLGSALTGTQLTKWAKLTILAEGEAESHHPFPPDSSPRP